MQRHDEASALTTRNLHLIVATGVIVPVALAYGLFPAYVATRIFHIANTVGVTHLFRVLMMLYLGIAATWSVGVIKPRYWRPATVLNVVFMGALATGRLFSFVIDGVPSTALLIGFGLEAVLAAWGLINLNRSL